MIYHIVVGDLAAAPLAELIQESSGEKVMILKDILNVGPVLKDAGTSFSGLRSHFWQQVVTGEKNGVVVDDMERLLELSKQMYQDENIVAWFWMAPLPADVCAYYWMLPYLSKHAGRFYLVNIANLPFLDNNGKLYYPKSISEISVKELAKARRLARAITPAETEMDGEEWEKLALENQGIRIHEGGKKIASRDEAYYDGDLLKFCTDQFQKAFRIVNQALGKHIPTGDLYLGWRLRKMAESGILQIQGDTTKSLRDFEVRLTA